MKDVEIITIDSKKYAIMNEVTDENITYLYLSNIDDPNDVMIRKSSSTDENEFIPLEDEEEFHLATLLLFKENKKDDQ